jgi:hypothetical protein
VSYHDWIPLVVKRLAPTEHEMPQACREVMADRPRLSRGCFRPLPIVALTEDVRVEHRTGWVSEAVVYHFDCEAYRVGPAP